MYAPNSDKRRSLVGTRRKMGSDVGGCAKLVDIRMLNIANDGLVMSLVYCAIYAQLLVLQWRLLSLAHLGHCQWFIMHP